MLNADPTDPTDPMLSADPTDPMLSTEPWEAILNRDPSDHRDHFDSTTGHLRDQGTAIRRAGTPMMAIVFGLVLRAGAWRADHRVRDVAGHWRCRAARPGRRVRQWLATVW
jgi:hypothetical protein